MSMDHDDLAMFWGRVLSEALFKPPDDPRSDRQILLGIAGEPFIHPNGSLRRFGLSTLKSRLKKYRDEGIQGLKPTPRSDQGAIRGDRQAALERACEIKREDPFRSAFTIGLLMSVEGYEPIPESTLQRHFSQRGLTIRKLGLEGTIIRKRWSREHTHSLWVGDFSQGPMVLDEEGRSHKTWISAFIDAHSRFVVVGIYALNGDMDALVRSLLAAFERHGKPRAMYLDNAKVYRSSVLGRACLDLGIELIHRAPYDPQGGGIIERFFMTLQGQLEREIVGEDKTPPSLSRLNDLLESWLAAVYHRRRHSATKQTPRDRYTTGLLHPVAPLRTEEARKSFYNEVQRTVHSDFCDIVIDQVYYRVPPELRGDRVRARYPLGDPGESVELRALKGRKILGQGVRHERRERYVPDPPPKPTATTDLGEALLKIHRRQKEEEGERLPQERPRREWDLATFVTKVCEVCDFPVDSLSESDLEGMAAIHRRRPELCMKKLREIWKGCQPKTLSVLLIELGKGGVS